jgi:hypothetical protein
MFQRKVLTPTTSPTSPKSSDGRWPSNAGASKPPSRSTAGSPKPN